MKSEHINGVEIFNLENEFLRVAIAPALGGKILSVYNKKQEKEFLWTNKNLQPAIREAGTDYDSNFLGGIDELIPNDIPETIDGISYPDHGELWTTRLQHQIDHSTIKVFGTLALSGLHYSKTVSLIDGSPSFRLDYIIGNGAGEERKFLWKLHAALNIAKGNKLLTTARTSKVVDPEYSRFKKELNAFDWPHIESTDASVVLGKSDKMDFLYLYDIPRGEMQLLDNDGNIFSYSYDHKIFPYQWWFASYGGFLDHYTAILEPCTNMPISVNDAAALRQSAILKPGESLNTAVTIFAGPKNNYIQQ